MQSALENAIKGYPAVNIPGFLRKLWNMVNDPLTDHLISWSECGDSFTIQNRSQFWFDHLPLYYKHNNMSSFIRQLNMYGFHKITTPESGSMDIEKDEITFYHPYFQRDKPELLREIKRKINSSKVVSSQNYNEVSLLTNVNKVLEDVKKLSDHQTNVNTQLLAIRQENAVLWRELALMRQKHMNQQKIVNKLIHFLATIVRPSNRISGLGVKRPSPLMINGFPGKKTKANSTESTCVGPTIFELDTEGLPTDFLEVSNDNQQSKETFDERTDEKVQRQTPYELPQNSSTENLLDDLNMNNVGCSASSNFLLNSSDLIKDDKIEFTAVGKLFGNSPTELPEQAIIDNSLPQVASEEVEESIGKSLNNFLANPYAQDALLSNLTNGSYSITNNKKEGYAKQTGNKNKIMPLSPNNVSIPSPEVDEMAISIRDASDGRNYRITREKFDEHLQNTQYELEQLKGALHSDGTFDASALMKLFSDSPSYSSLIFGKDGNFVTESQDINNELTSDSPEIDVDEFFNDSVKFVPVEWSPIDSRDIDLNNVQCAKKEPLPSSK